MSSVNSPGGQLVQLFAAFAGDHALVRAALAGEDGPVRQLVERLMPVVRSTVYGRLARHRGKRPSWDEVDDFSQEIWVSLLARDGRKLRDFDPERGVPLEGFVSLIASREVISLLRKQGAKKRAGDRFPRALDVEPPTSDPTANPEAVTAARAESSALSEWLSDRLPERGQLVARFLYEDLRSPAEIAKVLGVNLQVVYNWQHRIRSEVRAFLDLRA